MKVIQSIRNFLDKLLLGIDKFNRLMKWGGVIFVIALTGVVTREVVMRYIFNQPSGLTIELSKTLLIYFGCLCAGYVQAEKAHLNMESLLEAVSPKVKKIMITIGYVLAIIFCAIMSYYCFLMLMSSVRSREAMTLTDWPIYIAKLATVIGFIVLGLQFVVDAWKCANNLEDKLTTDIEIM